MVETVRNYQSISDTPTAPKNGSGNNFFVHMAGNTRDAHRPIVRRFTDEGEIEVTSPEQCDYLLVFCPVVSRVGTDINEALDHIPDGKKAVLVVMHHTFNPQHRVNESSSQVRNRNVRLTVDCLFYESELLSCDLNDQMWREVYEFLGVYQPPCCQTCFTWMKYLPVLVALGCIIALMMVLVILVYDILEDTHKLRP